MEQRVERHVPVLVYFDWEGKMGSVLIEFDEEHWYEVDKVLDVRRCACESVSGVGDRYLCRILRQETYLRLEKGRWFVSAKVYREYSTR